MRVATYIPSPKRIQKLRRTLSNIRNLGDSVCFVYCNFAALFSAKCCYLVFRLLSGFPASEKSKNLAVNNSGLDCNEIYPIYFKARTKFKKKHLLLISNEEKSHYCLIKNLDRLLKTLLRSDRTASLRNKIRKI